VKNQAENSNKFCGATSKVPFQPFITDQRLSQLDRRANPLKPKNFITADNIPSSTAY